MRWVFSTILKFVILDTEFLKTLDARKHLFGLCRNAEARLDFYRGDVGRARHFRLAHPYLEAVAAHGGRQREVKERIVEQDPHEKGIRKALYLGQYLRVMPSRAGR